MTQGANSNETYHLHNTFCPECREQGKDGSGDNLGIYSDGHAHCWSCGFYRSGAGTVTRGLRKDERTNVSTEISLPDDCEIAYQVYQIDWILKYNLSVEDLHNMGALYSKKGIRFYNKKHGFLVADNVLIFPIWGGDGLQGYQGRYFGKDARIPKWIGKGKLNLVFNILPGNKSHKESTIVLVEDIISAYKVNLAGYTAMPLYGMNSTSRLDTLKLLGYTSIILWLDPNMKKEMIKQGRKAELKGFKYRSIFSDADPKEHTVSEIRKYLTDNR